MSLVTPLLQEDLEAWPSADLKPIYEPDHDCDACMISGKGSTYSMTLFGSRYDEHYFPVCFAMLEPKIHLGCKENVSL
jgi:hypothetical protein